MGHVIAVMPASGGVGASTLAAVIAVRAAAATRSVVAADLDRFGGRLDVVLGAEQEPGWRWDRLCGVAGVVDGASLARELPRAGAVPVLAGSGHGRHGPGEDWIGILPDVVAGLAAAHGVTVLDVGRDPAVVAAVARLVDAWAVVVGTGVPQLASAAVSVPMLRRLVDAGCADSSGDGPRRRSCEPWVVLRGGRIEDEVADAVCDHLDVPIVARVRDDPRLVADVTCGVPPGSRGRGPAVEAADEVLLRLVSRPPLELGDGRRAARGGPPHTSGEGSAAEPASEWRWSA